MCERESETLAMDNDTYHKFCSVFSRERKKKTKQKKIGELNKILCLKIDILINVATNKVLVPLAMESL